MSIAPDLEPPPRHGIDAPASGLLDRLLAEQQSTAVEKFAQWHSDAAAPLQSRYYRDLIPLERPGPGEQYAFEVDLDCCTGCKACVVACHNLNGLEPEETWRSVGLLHGGSSQLPVLQHVTTACHHCLEPACLEGCPVEAYEKDPITGIVKHLDDQCIGCQYCILKCPYDVPRYSASKGIVRKCDMCSSRLAVGEAPACVQSCPNQAIRIALVSRAETAENAEANLFLPGAPEPGYTLPTTVYKTKKPLPANLLPADYFSATRQHAHLPLVLMLVLTQMSVGAFVVDQAMIGLVGVSGAAARGAELLAAFALGMLGMAASIFHLGRPHLAYRAFLGWRKSWLSREVIAFGAFAATASVYALFPWFAPRDLPAVAMVERFLGAAVAVSGLAGVFCSTMIYASTRRALWNPVYTGLKFLLTSLVLGIPLALLIRSFSAWSAGLTLDRAGDEFAAWQSVARIALPALALAAALKLLAEAAIFLWLSARQFTPLRRTALLMTGDLSRATAWRFVAGVLGGVVLPLGVLLLTESTAGLSTSAWIVVIWALCFVGELLERYLFFAAVVAPKMPGAPSA